MMFKESFKSIRCAPMFNNSSVYYFINVNSCNI